MWGTRLLAIGALALACGPAAQTSTPSTAPGAPDAAEAPVGPGWRYEVVAGPGAEELAIAATFAPGSPEELSVDDGVERFVKDVEIAEGGSWRRVEPTGTSWLAPLCRSRGCRIRYRFMLGDAARARDELDIAAERGGVMLAPPSTWLLHPLQPAPGAPFVMHVTTPPGISFATGVLPAPGGAPDTYQADVSDLFEAPYSAFGPMQRARIALPGGAVELGILPGEMSLRPDALRGWVEGAARAVATYYGRFPLPHALVLLLPTRGASFGFAKTLGNGGATILAPIGGATREESLRSDWVMTHELVHLAFPNMPRKHLWLEEGIATYVEPIARARMGTLDASRVWHGLIRGLPRGLPQEGDRGLDETPTWGRTYWGGALFCLLADVEIREKTANARSLDDALRGILAAGGNITVRWPLARALEVGDAATGLHVLRDMHARMGSSPSSVDLDALWKRLGVRLHGGEITYDDAAPLAAIRRAITAKPGAPPPR